MEQIFRGEALIGVLSRQLLAVNWIRKGERAALIPTDKAILVVKAGRYEGKGTARRIRYIREAQA